MVITFKYHVFAPMGRFQLELIYLYFPPSFHLTVGCFCPVGLSTGLLGVEVTSVSWLGQLTVKVTSTPTRPVENVVITTKGLQDRNKNC